MFNSGLERQCLKLIAKIHDQFLLISLFTPVFITSITEGLYIYCSLTENLSTYNFETNLYFVFPLEKRHNRLTDEQRLIKKLIV